MTKKEAFKIGFAAYMAEHGICPSSLNILIEKRAADSAKSPWSAIGDTAGEGLGAIGTGLKNLAGLGLKGLGMAGKGVMYGIPAAGALAGWASTGNNPVTPQDLKAMESMGLINEYQDAIRKMNPLQKKKVVRPEITAEERTPEFKLHQLRTSDNPALDLSKVSSFSKLAGPIDANIEQAKKKLAGQPVAPTQPTAPIKQGPMPAGSLSNVSGQTANTVPAPKPLKL